MRALLVLPLSLLTLLPSPASALTGAQVLQICATAEGDCREHPLLQAYVGGALDMVAVLDEQAGLASKLYCRPPEELFAVSAIIGFMQEHAADYQQRNAMLLVLRYLDENGGCA